MIRPIAMIFTAAALLEQSLASRHLSDISVHDAVESEATAACESMSKNECKFGKKKAPKGYKCEWMYDCYKGGQKEAGPVGHPSECGRMKMSGVGVCVGVSLSPEADEETTVPSEETEEESEEETVPETPDDDDDDDAETVDTEEPEPVAPKMKSKNEDEEEEEPISPKADEEEEEEESKPSVCGGAWVHWRTCGTRSGCKYVKKADVDACRVSYYGCYDETTLAC